MRKFLGWLLNVVLFLLVFGFTISAELIYNQEEACEEYQYLDPDKYDSLICLNFLTFRKRVQSNSVLNYQ